MDFAEKRRKVEHLLRIQFPFSWAPPPLTPVRGLQAGFDRHELHKRLMAKVEAERATLLAKSDDEIERLFVASGTAEQAKAEMLAAIEEAGRFFSKSEARADFEYWAKVEYWSLDESIALLLGKSPDRVNWKTIQAYVKISAFAKQYERMRNLALRAQAMNRGQTTVYPNAVLAWADEVEIAVPKALREALERQWSKRQVAPSSAVDKAAPSEPPEQPVQQPSATIGEEHRGDPASAQVEKPVVLTTSTNPSLTTDEICDAFDGVGMTSLAWRIAIGKNLPDWLTACRTKLGKPGANPVQARWDPLKLAAALVNGESRKAGFVPVAKLDAAFRRPPLQKFARDWQELRSNNPAWGE